MHYQTKLLPIDAEGGFLLAICHGEHQIGGEDTRETGYARFAVGTSATPESLRDLSTDFVLARPASASAARFHQRMADSQGQLARSGIYGQAMSGTYLDNETAARHAAAMAKLDGVRIPRRIYASRAGTALLGFEAQLQQTSGGESLPGVLRLVNLADGVPARDWKSLRAPLDSPGRGIERFSSVQLGRPLAFSLDGKRVLLNQQSGNSIWITECALEGDLAETGRKSLRTWRSTTAGQDWLVADDELLTWLTPGLEERAQAKIPRGALGWTFRTTTDGALVAMSGTVGGDVFVVPRDGGKARRFSPHRGAPREARMSIAISDCGGWLASRCEDELAITRLHDGVSWPLCELKDRVHHDVSFGDYLVRSSVPAAFAFIGGRLLVVEDGVVRTVDFVTEGAKAFISEHGRAGARKPIRVKRGMPLPELLSAARLKHQADALTPFHSPAVAIKTKPLGKSGWLLPTKPRGPVLGSSRIGGWPDLPAGVEWPRWQDRPMAFLAQINLAEAHAVEPELRLPAAGLLSFFLGCSAESYQPDGDSRARHLVDLMAGTEPTNADAWRVLFHPDTTRLERRTCADSPLPELFKPCEVRFVRGGLPLPDESTAVYPLLTSAMSEAQRDDFNELVGRLQPGDERTDHQLMGYPRLIQFTPPELMCELSARGASPWKFPAADTPEFTELAHAASRWALLLQLTSDGAADFCWGDGGHFYFYGDREAMARGDFSKTWVNFEN